jgi:four helix bundle protein
VEEITMAAKSFEDLIVWQKAYELSEKIDRLTATFPAKEQFELTDQMRRAASSLPTNIAEGFGRWTAKDQAHFYGLARSSGNELKVHLMRAVDRGYCSDVFEIASLLDEVCAMLYVLRKKVLSRGR